MLTYCEPEGLLDLQEFSADVWPVLDADDLTGPIELDQAAAFRVAGAASVLRSTPFTEQVGMGRFAPAAANSYARMLRAGMPQTGYNNSLRTFAQQVALWEAYKAGRGNLAANPYARTSNHQRGLAMDVNTGSPMQRWLVANGAEHGWIRDVPGEPWHFHYIATRDRHRGVDKSALYLQKNLNNKGASPRLLEDGFYGVKSYRALLAFQRSRGLVADGIDGPKTWAALRATSSTPPPPPSTPTPDLLARVGTLNCAGWSTNPDDWTDAERRALVELVRRLAASVVLLTECPEFLRWVIRDGLAGGREKWLVLVRGSQAILFDSEKWIHGEAEPLRFGPTDYHGGLWAVLKNATTGLSVVFGAYHLPPNSVSSDRFQIEALADLVAAMPKAGPRILGGDGADESSWVKGWDDARLVAFKTDHRTTPTYQGKYVRDRIHVAGGVTVRGYQVQPATVTVDGRKVTPTDHAPVLAQVTIPGTPVPTT